MVSSAKVGSRKSIAQNQLRKILTPSQLVRSTPPKISPTTKRSAKQIADAKPHTEPIQGSDGLKQFVVEDEQ
jgi:hypothetical protein